MRRRTFLSTSAAVGAAMTASGADSGKLKAGDVPKRVFGKTGERLTIIGQAGGRFPMCSYEDAKAITLRAYELGLNYFDTARIYWGGRSEEVYGDVLPAFRKQSRLAPTSLAHASTRESGRLRRASAPRPLTTPAPRASTKVSLGPPSWPAPLERRGVAVVTCPLRPGPEPGWP